jgi:hypothetical protein
MPAKKTTPTGAGLPPAADDHLNPMRDPLAEPDPLAPIAPLPTPEQVRAVRAAYKAGQEIEGIHLLRVAFDLDLAAAKALADAIESDPRYDGIADADGVAQAAPARFTVHDGRDGAPPEPAEPTEPMERPAEVVAIYATPAGRKVLATKQRDYSVPLTDEERRIISDRLAQLEADVAEEEAATLAMKQAAKKRMDALKGERSKLAADYRTGSTTRNLLVVEEIDYEAGVVRDIDGKTGQVLGQRRLNDAEAQVPMFVGPSPSAPDPHRLDPVDEDEGEPDGDDEPGDE